METEEAELVNGIFNFLVTLIQVKSNRIGATDAKQEVIAMLEEYISALRLTGNENSNT